MKDIKISIIGFGDVGQGVAKVLSQKQQTLEKLGVNIKEIANRFLEFQDW